jgi:hypothetical protein
MMAGVTRDPEWEAQGAKYRAAINYIVLWGVFVAGSVGLFSAGAEEWFAVWMWAAAIAGMLGVLIWAHIALRRIDARFYRTVMRSESERWRDWWEGESQPSWGA